MRHYIATFSAGFVLGGVIGGFVQHFAGHRDPNNQKDLMNGFEITGFEEGYFLRGYVEDDTAVVETVANPAIENIVGRETAPFGSDHPIRAKLGEKWLRYWVGIR